MEGDKLLSVAHSSKQTNRTRTEKGSSKREAAAAGGGVELVLSVHIHMQMAVILRPVQGNLSGFSSQM